MTMGGALRTFFIGPFSVVLSILVPAAHAVSSCPGDLNGDHMVTVDEILGTVSAALDGCPVGPGCGDGITQAALGEQCDGTDLGGASCTSLGFGGGTLACTASCEFDATGCTCGGGGLLKTGQTDCDQGSGTLGACPGSPPGQDGAIQAGIAASYTTNEDGTVRDNVTGLVWEKLSDDGSIHDWNKTYSWNDAFNVKIAALNTAPCFTGHCDWRLPNRRELESLVDVGQSGPAIDPSFNAGCTTGCKVTACSCTQSDYYWSSTTYPPPQFAWGVDFAVGAVNGYDKGLFLYYVRAVRGGMTSAQVIDEPHVAVSVPGDFSLGHPNATLASIVVAVKSTSPPFSVILLVANINYTVTAVGSTVVIHVLTLPAPFVLPGSYDFLVSYSLAA